MRGQDVIVRGADRKSRNGATGRTNSAEWRDRLVASADFGEWLFRTLYTLCAFEHDLRDTTEFERGIRAAGALVQRELLEADGSAELLARLQKRYFEGVKRGILEARKREEQGEDR